MNLEHLYKFIAESNHIEGIHREITLEEIEAHKAILALDKITVPDLQNFVAMIAPGHKLRDQVGLDVYVGNHTPRGGGPAVREELELLLEEATRSDEYPWHCAYESLHPFTDGNGRSGRALWLWMHHKCDNLDRALALGFLHTWYYESLEAHDND